MNTRLFSAPKVVATPSKAAAAKFKIPFFIKFPNPPSCALRYVPIEQKDPFVYGRRRFCYVPDPISGGCVLPPGRSKSRTVASNHAIVLVYRSVEPRYSVMDARVSIGEQVLRIACFVLVRLVVLPVAEVSEETLAADSRPRLEVLSLTNGVRIDVINPTEPLTRLEVSPDLQRWQTAAVLSTSNTTKRFFPESERLKAQFFRATTAPLDSPLSAVTLSESSGGNLTDLTDQGGSIARGPVRLEVAPGQITGIVRAALVSGGVSSPNPSPTWSAS